MTNSIIISDISIRQDSEGRYSVNDLHKAAGGERRHEPKNWLNNQQTQELIEVIINTGISVFSPITSKRGCKGGTYVCKELVYAYATWISSEFFLKVIMAYDALVSGDTEKAESIARSDVDDRTPLRSMVNRIMGKYGVTYQAVYKMVHREFGVKHIDELSTRQTAEAMEYLSTKVIEGEFLGKEFAPAITESRSMTDSELCNLCWLWSYATHMAECMAQVYPILYAAEHRLAGTFFSMPQESPRVINAAREALLRETRHIEAGMFCDSKLRVLHHMRSAEKMMPLTGRRI